MTAVCTSYINLEFPPWNGYAYTTANLLKSKIPFLLEETVFPFTAVEHQGLTNAYHTYSGKTPAWVNTTWISQGKTCLTRFSRENQIPGCITKHWPVTVWVNSWGSTSTPARLAFWCYTSLSTKTQLQIPVIFTMITCIQDRVQVTCLDLQWEILSGMMGQRSSFSIFSIEKLLGLHDIFFPKKWHNDLKVNTQHTMYIKSISREIL